MGELKNKFKHFEQLEMLLPNIFSINIGMHKNPDIF